MKRQTRGSLMLLLTAMIWGAAFVAQSEGAQYIGPFTMQFIRFLLAGLVLLPLIAALDRRGMTPNRPRTPEQKRAQLLAGVVCGALLFAASTLQQFGIARTTVGKSGFLTALYIIFIPIFGLFSGKRAPGRIWLCVAMAVAGFYLLCMGSDRGVNLGDLLTLGCSVFFTLQICYIDRVSAQVDAARLACTQFFTCSALSLAGMLLFEQPSVSAIAQCWVPVVYAGVFSGGVGYTLQIFGQKDVPPTLAGLLMSLESVFAALFGWLLLQQALRPRELAGCAVIFVAIILAQLPSREKKRA